MGLNDDVRPKKKGIFARLGDFSSSSAHDTATNNIHSSSQHSKVTPHIGLHLPGRKRGHSGAGAELSAMKASVPVVEKELV